MTFLIVFCWLLGTVVSYTSFSYLKGRADARFRDNKNELSNPPFILGIITSPFWMIQLPAAVALGLYFLANRTGSRDGYAINQELDGLRKQSSIINQQTNRTLKVLTDNNIDPKNIDDTVIRALNARAIEWAMEENAAQQREANGFPVLLKSEPRASLKDEMFNVLDKNGVVVQSADYDDYHDRTKGELDL